MNPFQRARDEAWRLRQELLGARVAEAVRVQEFLNTETLEKKVKLAVQFVARGSTDLGTSDAILRRSEQTIYVAEDFAADERAQLVAHELGHERLDEDALEDSTIGSLAALLGPEGTPAAVHVEAYGARERNELRANVFARELQLPRQVARKLFEAGHGPRQVALDLGIHHEVVRQQMLDAVMLPAVPAPPAQAKDFSPSPDQRDAARAKERCANVVAGPGAGKTATLIDRVRHLIEDRGVDPARILVLTFTNKAAFELVDRLRAAGIARAADVWAGTFHAFGLEFLRKYHQHFDLNPDIRVADKLNSVTLLNTQLPAVQLKHYKRVQDPYDWLPQVVSGIKRLKEEMVTPAQYAAAIADLPADEQLALRRQDVAALFEQHEQALAAIQMVDFVDLVAKPARALQEDRARFTEFVDRFEHVLVDEYQDVTHAMVQLVKQLARGGRSLWVVGDVRQAIHHWRGASVESLRRFAQTFKEQAGKGTIREYPLEKNRRSSPQILEVVKHVGREHVLQQDLKLADTSSTEPDGPLPLLVRCTPTASFPAAIAEQALALNDETRYGAQAVLVRGNHDLEPIAAALKQVGVPVLYIGELAARTEIKRLLCLMQLLVERQPRALVGLTGTPGYAVDQQSFDLLMQACKNDPALQRGSWLQEVPQGLTKQGAEAAARLAKLLAGHKRSSRPWDFICDLLLERRFGFPALADQSIEAHTVRIALWQFAYAGRAGDGDNRRPSLTRFLMRQQLRQRIHETYSERELPPEAAVLNGVRLLTVHGSKGLEFDAVHVANVKADDFGPEWPSWRALPDILQIVPPEVLGSTQDAWEDEAAVERNNLLYVAVSRARRRLLVYESGNEPDRRAPQMVSAARLFDRAAFTLAQDGPTMAAKPALPQGSAQPIPFNEFETYARCPLQHWYRYRIDLPAERQVDIATRASWAAMDALRHMASGAGTDLKTLFTGAWEEHKLPPRELDPQLWQHAAEILKVGALKVRETQGTFTEPRTGLNGLVIQLPWVIATSGGKELHEFKFKVGDLDHSIRFRRPLLNGLLPPSARKITLYSLLDGRSMEGNSSGAITMTAAYKASQKWHAGDRAAVPGRYCAWCAYATVCPALADA